MPYKDPEKHKAAMRRWYAKNREREQTKRRNWHADNRERSRELGRDYYASHRESVIERNTAWKKDNLDKSREHARRSAHKRRASLRATFPGDSLTDEWVSILEGDRCSLCGGPGEVIEHIQAISKGGGNNWDNLARACAPCNRRKYNKSLLEALL